MIPFARPLPAGQQWLCGTGTAGTCCRAKHPLRALLLLPGIVLVSLVLLLSLFFYTPAYTLSIGGAELGPVASREMAETARKQAEGQIAEILGHSYSMPLALDARLTVAAKKDLLTYTELAQALHAYSPAIKPAYVLSVDGVELGAAANSAVLHAALTDLQEQYRTADTQALVFANETRITRQYIPAQSAYTNRSDLLAAALSPKGAAVQAPQAVRTAARTNGANAGGLPAGYTVFQTSDSPASPSAGAEQSTPLLSVFTLDRVRSVEEIASPVREVPDPERYEDETALLLEGRPGLLLALTDVTKLNGEALHAETVSEFVLLPASETVMAVGTKERPSYLGSGSFQWPCQGQLTSPFGYRHIFGSTSFHSGIDIANSRGTSITAADNGIVTFADYKGSYGNLIILDHGNGYQTAYAHCNSMGVSVGQGVLQGETIASMGTSGRATGSHCHFELRIDGTQVDPQPYLP